MRIFSENKLRKAITVFSGLSMSVVLLFSTATATVADHTEAVLTQKDSAVQISLAGKDYTTLKGKITATVGNQSLNTVKQSIFGANVSWIDDGNGLWDSKQQQPYKTLTDKLAASGVYHIRYPGGIEGDYLHWYDTVGPVAKRTASIDPFSAEYPTYDSYNGVEYVAAFGVDELYKVCKAAGVKATVQLNAGNGTPQEAKDYFDYLKKNNYLKMTDSICVGNEVCMSAENVDGMSVTKNPDDYILFCNDLFKKLGKNVINDKNIKLGVIGITSSHPLCAYKNWDAKILDALAPQIDFIDVHIGYSYYSQGNAGKDDSVRCFMASSKWISDMINEEKAIIEKYAGSSADDIDIQITEMGPVGGDYPNSLAGAIFLADLYNVILAEPKISATDYLPLLNHYASAQLIGAMTYSGVSKDEYYWNNAVSYVYKMYSDLVGSDVLKTDLSGYRTFNAKAVGLVPAVSDVPLGSVAAYYDENTKTGSLFVMNKSLNQNQNFEIQLPTDRAEIVGVTELWNKNPVAANTYTEPNNITLKTYKGNTKTKTGKIELSAKPVSLVKIDFKADGIQVIAPVKKSGEKVSENTENPPEQQPESEKDLPEQQDEPKSDPVNPNENNTLQAKNATVLLRYVHTESAYKIVLGTAIALAAVWVLEAVFVAVYLQKHRREGKR